MCCQCSMDRYTKRQRLDDVGAYIIPRENTTVSNKTTSCPYAWHIHNFANLGRPINCRSLSTRNCICVREHELDGKIKYHRRSCMLSALLHMRTHIKTGKTNRTSSPIIQSYWPSCKSVTKMERQHTRGKWFILTPIRGESVAKPVRVLEISWFERFYGNK